MIPKSRKDLSFPQNHRLISILSTMGKTVDRINMKSRLKTFSEDQQILLEKPVCLTERTWNGTTGRQSGRIPEKGPGRGRPGRGQSVGLSLEGWSHSQADPERVPRCLIHLLESNHRDRTFQVRIKETKSSTRTADASVPQGTV